MRKEKTLFIIGLWIVLLSFSGFSPFVRKILFSITGLAIMYLAYLYYLEVKFRLSKDINNSKTFVDNIGSSE